MAHANNEWIVQVRALPHPLPRPLPRSCPSSWCTSLLSAVGLCLSGQPPLVHGDGVYARWVGLGGV